jgi:copper chaperone CopZ
MKKVELNVFGMSCGHCVDTVHSVLTGVEGVADVDVSLTDGRASVHAHDSADEEGLVQAIEQAGYRAVLSAER